jgi:cellulose biosynthesis protein BcsQ
MAAPSPCTVFVLANHKGGWARTTSVANLGVAFAQLGLRTLLIDADPQGNLGEAFGVEPDHPEPRLHDADPTRRRAGDAVSALERDGLPVALAGGVHLLLPGGAQLEEAVSARTAEPDSRYGSAVSSTRCAHATTWC